MLVCVLWGLLIHNLATKVQQLRLECKSFLLLTCFIKYRVTEIGKDNRSIIPLLVQVMFAL